MRSRASGDLLSLPVRLHGIELGRVVDLIVEREAMRVLGLEVRCPDDTHRFLPLAAPRAGEADIAIGSPLLLLDELSFYRARGRSLQALRGRRGRGRRRRSRRAEGRPRRRGRDDRARRHRRAASEREVPVDAAVTIRERRAPAA